MPSASANARSGWSRPCTSSAKRAPEASAASRNAFTSSRLGSGTAIVGFQVPKYDEVLVLLEDIVRRIPQIRYVGWDIAVTPEGPWVLTAEDGGVAGLAPFGITPRP